MASATSQRRRAVYYSLAVPESGVGEKLRWQLETSVESLRAHNSRIPVHLLLYGDLPGDMLRSLIHLGVTTHQHPSYKGFLEPLCARHVEVLCRYAPLHKWLNLATIDDPSLDQILYLDCDTYCFSDIARLFDKYSTCDWYAREEQYSCQGPSGAVLQPTHMNAMEALAAREGVTAVPPLNTGIVLMNHGVWRSLDRLRHIYLQYVWRLVVWMALHVDKDVCDYSAVTYLRDCALRFVTGQDRLAALPMPTVNRWIAEEVALWLTIGHMRGSTVGYLDSNDALQGGEFVLHDPGRCSAVVCHYYSALTEYFYLWRSCDLEVVR